jgi:hypothetical protein
MANALFLASTLVMGLLVAGVVALMVRGRPWRHYTPQVAYGKLSAGGGVPRSAISRAINTPSVWTAAFLLLVVVIIAGTVAVLGGSGSVITAPVLIGLLGVVIVGNLVGGVFVAMRSNGRPFSQAIAASVVTLGALFLLGLTVRLVLSG